MSKLISIGIQIVAIGYQIYIWDKIPNEAHVLILLLWIALSINNWRK